MEKKNVILFDDLAWEKLLPLTYTKPCSELRVGINTIREKWHYYFEKISWKTQEYLSEKYPIKLESDNIFIAANIIPNKEIVNALAELALGEALIYNDKILAFRSENFNLESIYKKKEYSEEFIIIENTWDLFEYNDVLIRQDFDQITKNHISQVLDKTNNYLELDNIFIEEGAEVKFATLDASLGPIYIGKEAQVMAGALIQGPFALCEHATVKMGAKIYGATTVGPWSKVAGEVQNSVITGYSNKGHDGYLGNAVLGEWCNIGADTNNSNLKNNYEKVKLWDYTSERFVNTNLQFCGLIMGDHSKCGINTMFNTGTVIGVSANIYGAGFPRNFIPSFSWGGAAKMDTYPINKALQTAKIVMARRKIELNEVDTKILSHVYETTKKFRK